MGGTGGVTEGEFLLINESSIGNGPSSEMRVGGWGAVGRLSDKQGQACFKGYPDLSYSVCMISLTLVGLLM